MSDISKKLAKFERSKPSRIIPVEDSEEEIVEIQKDEIERTESPVLTALKMLKSPKNNRTSSGTADADDFLPLFNKSKAKRVRLMSSESEPDSPLKNSASSKLTSQNADECQEKVDKLKAIFPDKDDLELQDALVENGWDLEGASNSLVSPANGTDSSLSKSKITSSASSSSSSLKSTNPVTPASRSSNGIKGSNRKGHGKPERKRVKVDLGSDEEEGGDDYITKMDVYFSDDSDEEEVDKRKKVDQKKLDENRKVVLEFFNEATLNMLASVPGCSKKKAEAIMEMRPFESWDQMVKKFKSSKQTSTEMLNKAKDVILMQREVETLMKKCERISLDLLQIVEEITSGHGKNQLTEQPRLIPRELQLSGYQMIGLNWLVLMHKQNLNGVLADEMGLGKTIQAISFLAYLFETGHDGPHLIVVPSSTMDNWQREIRKWLPSVELLMYHGSQEERRAIRVDWMYGRLSHVQVVLTTYNMVTSSVDDRNLFRKMQFEYVIYDEAHMLKNMATQRYEQLMRISAPRRLLLTGTPLQNSLVELMSLLVFVMPDMFKSQMDTLKRVFSMFPKGAEQSEKTKFERERVTEAKKIMRPFFLRRLKNDVLKDLPQKTEKTHRVSMATDQKRYYEELVQRFSKQVRERGTVAIEQEVESLEVQENVVQKKKDGGTTGGSGGHMLMDLRKLANHPLLMRYKYTDKRLRAMTRELMKEPIHVDAKFDFILEDLQTMSDFELHKTCYMYPTIKGFTLTKEEICISGKFEELDRLLPALKDDGARVLVFSQFVIMLDILEEYLKFRKHKFLRLDGSTPVAERMELIDKYSEDSSIFIFLLSTKAGGLGINLTAANTVILHDIDFNPHNDKQAEDRCHRLGQKREVRIIRLVSKDTIEDGMLQIAQDKLRLEKDLTNEDDSQNEVQTRKDVAKLLKCALQVNL